jgi:hypothetical protein
MLERLSEKKERLLENIEKYYVLNEGKKEKQDNKEEIGKKIRTLKKEKMKKEFDITWKTGFLLPLIYLIYSLVPKDTKYELLIVIIISVIIGVIYFSKVYDDHEQCIRYELEIDELERSNSKE